MMARATRYGDYLREIRLADPRELVMKDVAEALDISITHVSAVENCRKGPFSGKQMEVLAEFYGMTDEQRARMYDLASIENRGETIPYDIADTLMHEDVGDMARFALRQSKAGFIKEADWKQLIRKSEARKAKMLKAQGGNRNVSGGENGEDGDGDG